MKHFPYAAAAFCLTAGLLTVSAQADNTLPPGLSGKRAIAYLSTDKTIYRTGEPVRFRILSLDSETNFPARTVAAKYTVRDPRGSNALSSTVYFPDASAAQGLSWTVPDTAPGGVYTIRVEVPGAAPAERTFEVRAYRTPKIQTQIVFPKDGYRPGETVRASMHAMRAEGGIPQSAVAVARLDGQEIFRSAPLSFDASGSVFTEFPLPQKIEGGDGVLSFRISDGGVTETASKTIPVQLDNFTVDFYPEGGDLIAGLPNRVYVQARRRDGKPAAPDGTVAGISVSGEHEGRTSFDIVPQAGQPYELTLADGRKISLPEVRRSGALLRAGKNIYPFDGKIAMTVFSTSDSGAALLSLRKREKLLSSAKLVPGERAALELDPGDAEGVLTATVSDARGVPLAERLVFREPKYKVSLDISFDKKEYVPGSEVVASIRATGENGAPAAAILGIAAVDESALEMTDRREQPPALPAMVYLETETIDFADAHVYFDSANPNAARAIDLLLATQGWRRFIRTNYAEIKKQFELPAMRALAERFFPPVPQPRAALFARNDIKNREALIDIDMVDKKVQKDGFIREKSKAAVLKAVQPLAVIPPPMDPKPNEEKRLAADAAEIVLGDRVARQDKAPVAREEHSERILVLREYAHRARPDRRPDDRRDFTETVYWNCGLETNPRDGRAEIRFTLPDSVTTFRVSADAAGNNGALGAAQKTISVVRPFYTDIKLPSVVTSGDLVQMPVVFVNSTEKTLDDLHFSVRADDLESIPPESVPVKLDPKERKRAVAGFKAGKPGTYSISATASAGGFSDTVTRTVQVLPRCFPIERNAGGSAGPGLPFRAGIEIPGKIEPGTLRTKLELCATPLAGMEAALNALLRQPSGCFEQTSSTNYPVVMVRAYYDSHTGIAPEKIQKAKDLLADGYKRLVSFETKENGYEWFGANPGHEALTAYGLMQFHEMGDAADPAMVARTKRWLLSRRDGKGGFLRNERALDSFGRAPAPVTNAYILWTLLESGEPASGLRSEIEAVKKHALNTKDSYCKALAANILYLAGDNAAARTLCESLAAMQYKDGAIRGAETTITCSGGESKEIETTALAVLAFLRVSDSFTPQIENAMRRIFQVCRDGRFGSTQSTILALKAINAYDKSRAVPPTDGSVQLFIDGKKFGSPAVFTKETRGGILLPDFASAMTPGKHVLEVVMTGGAKMPAILNVSFATEQPSDSKECPLEAVTSVSSPRIAEGEVVDFTVRVTNRGGDCSMPLAVAGIPAGLELRHDRLKELVREGKIAAWEILGNELVLYWRGLKSGENVTLNVSATAAVPGEYRATPSRAYLYYTDEHKRYTPGVSVVIEPRR